MSNQKNGTNGTAEKLTGNGQHKAETTASLTVVKDEKIPTPKVEGIKLALPPLDERLHRLNELFEIQQKFNRLHASLARLKSFELDKDNETCRITFSDKNRNEFTTANQFLMPKFLAFVKTEISAKIKELEPLLKW